MFRPSLIAVALVSAAACTTTSEPADDVGQVDLALAGRSRTGAIYRLRDAQLAIAPVGQVFSTEADPDRTVITTRLDAGLYTLDLSDTWRLERITNGRVETVFAVLTSPDPQAFHVTPGGATTVYLSFRADGQDVQTGQGDVDVVLDVDDSSPIPDAGVPDGGIDASIDAATPSPPDAAPPPPPDAIIDAPAAPPTVTITSAPPFPTRNTTPFFVFASSEPAERVRCEIAGHVAQPCVSPFTSPLLPDGPYDFVITAFNADGASVTDMRSILIDSVFSFDVPAPAIIGPTATFQFLTAETATFTCALDGAPRVACTSPFTTAPLAPLVSHQLDVRGRDQAGNAVNRSIPFTVGF
jgi:hypothetical protein